MTFTRSTITYWVLLCLIVTAACSSNATQGALDGDSDLDESASDADVIDSAEFEREPDGQIPDGDNDQVAESDSESETELETELEPESELELEPDKDPEPEEEIEVSISGLSVIENPSNVLSFFIDWTTSRPVGTRLEVDCDIDYNETFKKAQSNTQHHVFVMGLVSGAHCSFTATVKVANKVISSEGVEIDVSALPENLPAIKLEYIEIENIQAGWTIFNLSYMFDTIPLIIAVVDEMGRYRWYHNVQTVYSGSDNDVRIVDEGVLIGGTRGQIEPRLVSWEGVVLWQENLINHHHIEPWGQDQYIYLTTVSGDCVDAPGWEEHPNVQSASVAVWDKVEQSNAWLWVMCQHYAPPIFYADWSHLNAIARFPDENALLLSSRGQHTLIKVDLDTDDVIWHMGGQLNDFQIEEGDVFFRQHSARVLENGNILMFDNGMIGTREFSRAIEVDYTFLPQYREAHIVWHYTPDPVIFTDIWSDTDRLPNGNTLITFGFYSDVQLSRFIEVTHDKPGRKVWELSLPVTWGTYRAQRIIEPIKGYIMAEK